MCLGLSGEQLALPCPPTQSRSAAALTFSILRISAFAFSSSRRACSPLRYVSLRERSTLPLWRMPPSCCMRDGTSSLMVMSQYGHVQRLRDTQNSDMLGEVGGVCRG
jgi:hypothetical protein